MNPNYYTLPNGETIDAESLMWMVIPNEPDHEVAVVKWTDVPEERFCIFKRPRYGQVA